MKKDMKEHAYVEKWKSITLSDASRRRMEEELLEYARFHRASEGVREEGKSRSNLRVPEYGTGGFSRFLTTRFNTMTAFILVLLLAGGGTSFAANGALPGELLYPVKIGVNEEVRSMLAFSHGSEARLQADLVRERLEEATELAGEGRLTAEVGTDIETRMKEHAEVAREESDEAEAKGDIEVATEVRASLTATLKSYVEVLGETKDEGENTGTSSLIIEIENEHEATVEADAKTNIDLDIKTGILDVGVKNTDSVDASSTSNEGSPRTNEHETTTSTDIDLETNVDVDTGVLDARSKTDTSVRTNTGIEL